MELLITGATGFVGRHLVEEALQAGHGVRALVRSGKTAPNGCTEVRGDLVDVPGFADALGGCDAVVHCGAAMDDVAVPAEVHRVNVLGSKELALAAVSRGVGRFVFISSVSAIGYPDREGIIDEGVECEPVTDYGRSKLAAEAELLQLTRAERLRVAILRPPTVYGHGETRNFLFLTRAVNTGLFLIPGTGNNRISFCNVKNLAHAVLFVVENEGVDGVFHLADRDMTTLRHVVEVIAQVLGTRIPPVPFPYPAALMAAYACEVVAGVLGLYPPLSRQRLKTLTRDFAFDGAALRARGFEPTASFESGVHATIEWYRNSGLIKRPHLLSKRRKPPFGGGVTPI